MCLRDSSVCEGQRRRYFDVTSQPITPMTIRGPAGRGWWTNRSATSSISSSVSVRITPACRNSASMVTSDAHKSAPVCDPVARAPTVDRPDLIQRELAGRGTDDLWVRGALAVCDMYATTDARRFELIITQHGARRDGLRSCRWSPLAVTALALRRSCGPLSGTRRSMPVADHGRTWPGPARGSETGLLLPERPLRCCS